MSEQKPDHLLHTKRDSETFIALGLFMVVLAVTVLVGTFYAVTPEGMTVNFGAGIVLLAIAIGFIWRGFIIKRRL